MAYGTSAYGTSAYGSVAGVEATAPVSQVQPATTWAAIRAQMVSVIRALTPKALAGETFRITQTEQPDFRTYAEGNDAAVFREFEIEDIDHGLDGSSDFVTHVRVTDCEIVVAYPHHWGLYQTASADNRHNEASLHAVMEQDADSILKAVGFRGTDNYLGGQRSAIEESWSPEAGEGVTFLVLPLTVTYFYDAS